MRPLLEPPGVLMRQGQQPERSQRRPADVLLTLSSWPGSVGDAFAKVAIDFAIINAMGPSHLAATLEGSGTAAASAYADRKRTLNNTAARCRENGVLFLPVVFTAQGGLEPGAAKTLEVIHRAASAHSGKSLPETRLQFSETVSISIVRANARASRRRDPDGPANAGTAAGRHIRRAADAYVGASVLRQPPADGNEDDGMIDVIGEELATTTLDQ